MSKPDLIPGYLKPANERAAEWAQQLVIFIVISLILLPILWIALTAFKLPRDVYSLDNALVFKPTLENFVTVFEHPWNLASKLFNSVLVASGTVLIAIPFALSAAYAFSRFEFKFKQPLFLAIIASQFIPAAVVVLPYFLMF